MPARSEPGALAALPAQQGRWVLAQVAVAIVLALAGAWAAAPELALAASLGAGAAAASPRRPWSAPTVLAGTLAAGLAAHAAGWPAVVGSGAAAGAFATWSLPHRTDGLDVVHGGLAGLVGASLGLWLAELVPHGAAVPAWVPVGVLAAVTGLGAAQGIVPAAIRFDHYPSVPTRAEVARLLAERYRAPVLRAIELFHGVRRPPEPATRRGLAEVVRWILELQRGLQALDRELAGVDPDAVGARIAEAEAGDSADAFTNERRQATAAHLRRLLDHRAALALERGRTAAMGEYALAFLEEARAGLAIAQPLPGEAVPERLPEVLARLRSEASSGLARRATAREMKAYDA